MNPFAPISAALLLLLAAFAQADSGEDDKLTTYEPPLAVKIGSRTVFVPILEESPPALLNALLDEYAVEQNIRATEAEIEVYSMVLEALRRGGDFSGLAESKEALKSPYLSKAQRQEFLASIKLQAQIEEEVLRFRANGETRDAASRFIVRWKVNAALHAQHGGRLISDYNSLQAQGVQPVDAYEKLIDERQKVGAFEDWPPDVQRELLAYYTATHWGKTRPADNPGTYFQNPPWIGFTKEQIWGTRTFSQELVLLAAENYRRGQFKAVVDFAKRAVMMFPLDANAVAWRARGYLGRGFYAEATRDFQTAAELEPAEPKRRVEMGLALQAQGKPKGASAMFEEAVRIRAELSTLTMRGKDLLARGQVGAAIADLTRAVNPDFTATPKSDPDSFNRFIRFKFPEFPDGWDMAEKLLGDAYLLKKEYALAAEHYTAAIWRNWEFAEAWQGRAKAKQALGDDVGAAEDFAGAREAARKREVRRKEAAVTKR